MSIYIPNIDENQFNKICEEKGLKFIYVSIPLPHGRLKDVDKLEVHDGWLSEAEGYSTHITFVYSNAIDLAPTIIEAEEEG